MDLNSLLKSKELKAKEKTENISSYLLEKSITVNDLCIFASDAKDPDKATCIEAIEFATKKEPAVMDKKSFHFVCESLGAKAPRIKGEAAKVIGNTAHLYPTQLELAITNLLANTEHEGTVVRWSAAFALGEILKLKTKHNKDLLPAIETICSIEEKNSIKKIYQAALKKTAK